MTFHTVEALEANLLNMKPILDELTKAPTSNTEHNNNPIRLHGQYHLFEYLLRSVNISIFGTPSSSIVASRTEEDDQDMPWRPQFSCDNPPIIVVRLKLQDQSRFKLESVFVNMESHRHFDIDSSQHKSGLETIDIFATIWNATPQFQGSTH
ncbi:hypothetical protein BLNAU_19915 [Blattamonas nauphoetae]|uniref:Uncharacterized protein n=1 Tax=Blattamonas nauphoetae TaxID=2049346 RepID=A0ABQ9X3E4_9EUKA|nr:hypothetical protein BLNAU_19915 [Blattamonas nauphoetae]